MLMDCHCFRLVLSLSLSRSLSLCVCVCVFDIRVIILIYMVYVLTFAVSQILGLRISLTFEEREIWRGNEEERELPQTNLNKAHQVR